MSRYLVTTVTTSQIVVNAGSVEAAKRRAEAVANAGHAFKTTTAVDAQRIRLRPVS